MSNVPDVVQKQPVARVVPEAAALMRAGFLARGEYEIRRAEIENVLWIQEMLDSGEYKTVVETALKTVGNAPAVNGAGDSENADSAEKPPSNILRLEPRRAFFQLMHMDEKTFTRRREEIKALGADSMAHLRALGVSCREIRMLAESPAEIRQAVKDMVASGESNKELVNVFVGKVQELTDARNKERQERKDAQHALAQTEGKLAKKNEKLAEVLEDNKSLTAELRQARAGIKLDDMVEVDKRIELGGRLLSQFFMLFGEIDWAASPERAAKLDAIVTTAQQRLRALTAQYLADL